MQSEPTKHAVAYVCESAAEQDRGTVPVPHLLESGVPVEEGSVERHGAGDKGLSVYFRDPDGTLLEFVSYQ